MYLIVAADNYFLISAAFFIDILKKCDIIVKVPQLSGCGAAGSALDWGSRGRKFKSCHSDHIEYS